MSGTIEFSIQDHVARLTLDQPSRYNALTFDMWCALPRLVATAEADPRVRLITVAGAGDAAFSAGADISEFAEKRSDPSGVARYDTAVRAASEALRYSRLPTLALIHGICFGGGLGLALCCDLRFASSEARFRIPAGRLGLGYGYDNIAPLVHRVGPAAAAEILFTASTFDADRAKDLRLVQQVFDRDDFDKNVESTGRCYFRERTLDIARRQDRPRRNRKAGGGTVADKSRRCRRDLLQQLGLQRRPRCVQTAPSAAISGNLGYVCDRFA
jgi:enoyl-CoA hydratase/carnithine racemase